jgi:hypothetical protein
MSEEKFIEETISKTREIIRKAELVDIITENMAKVLEYYEIIDNYDVITDSANYLEGQRFAIVQTLNLLGIKIEGVNA